MRLKISWAILNKKIFFLIGIPAVLISGNCSGNQVTAAKDEVTINFVGDVLMGSFIGNYIDDHGPSYPWNDVSQILNNSDLSVANLETSVSLRGETSKPPGYGFRSKPETLKGLVRSGIDIVSIANNHTLDFGQESFIDTLDFLKKYKIAYAGGGKNFKEADKPFIIKKNGISLAFLAYSEILPEASWEVSAKNPGINVLSEKKLPQILTKIKELSLRYDLVIIILHWGYEHTRDPNPWQVQMAHKMIDNGADLIIGHHPHVLQPVEFYKNKPVFYSLGNFVFLIRSKESSESGIFQLTLDKRGFKKGKFFPIFIEGCKANLLNFQNQRAKSIINTLNEISMPYNGQILPDGEIQEKKL